LNRTTTLSIRSYESLAADLGDENPLPVFRDAKHDLELPLDPNVTAEDRRYLGWQVGYRVLPYRMQDGYNRDKKRWSLRAVVLENEILRATFLPELGGRLVSLIHKATDRELLDRNPVFQPANLAIRNAWFSGGIEWNAGQFGHHCLTCSPVFAARVETPEGYPVLRLYEWDRMKCYPWQIDFHLPPGSEFLFACVRLVNPHERELPMYWWTNIAVPEADDVRVLAPATTALHYMLGSSMSQIDLPVWHGTDLSYATRLKFAQEFFCRIPDGRRRWIAALDATGTGLVETSTRRLRGRKLWAWGMNEGGRHWQDFLSQPGRAYIEIQAGLAYTQLESVPMPARAEWTWTEAFGLLEADAAKVHSTNWSEAIGAAESALYACLSERKLEELDLRFAATTTRPSWEILSTGSGWGALDRRRQMGSIPAGLAFDDSTLGQDQEPWLALLETGELSESAPGVPPSGGIHPSPPEGGTPNPGAWMVQPEWQSLLEKSLQAGRSDHWLAWLHLGNMRMENSNPNGAVEAWQRSLSHKRNAWALRNLAVVEQRAGNLDAAAKLTGEAWQVGPPIPGLAIEYVNLLCALRRFAEVDVFVRALPPAIRQHERIHIAAARAALELGRLDEVEPLFGREFVTIRESETSVTDLWFEYQARRIAEQNGVPLDDALCQRVRRESKPPRHIDFRMTAEA